MAEDAEATLSGKEMVSNFLTELVGSPLNLVLLGVCGYLLYKILSGRRQQPSFTPSEPELPPLKKSDFTVEQLREYDGTKNEGRLLMAVNGKVFDVTRGKKFYGPGGPYGIFAGKDASRGLATFSLNQDSIKESYDDLSDLNSMQMESIREWDMQFTEKYDYVGRLLKPGEDPTDYTDTEEEQSSHDKSKDE